MTSPDEWTEIEELAKTADDEVCALAEGKRKWTMSIPVRNTDSDILISDALRKIPGLIALARSEAMLRRAVAEIANPYSMWASMNDVAHEKMKRAQEALAESDRLRSAAKIREDADAK